jgi:hypothetical protein
MTKTVWFKEGAYVYYDEHIAALRRAKAEVLQEVMELCLRDPLFKQFVEKGFWGAHHVDIVWRHNGQDKQHEADWLKSLWYLLRKLDARAAQIEEGREGGNRVSGKEGG